MNDSPILKDCLPRRKSPRADWHNYSTGAYFITICTKDMHHYFGYVDSDSGEMIANSLGNYTAKVIDQLPLSHAEFSIPMYVIMPNHIHLIIIAKSEKPHALGRAVKYIKTIVSYYAHNILGQPFAWQHSYHDHVIRNKYDARNITEYIRNNPARWASDRYHSSHL